MGGIYSAIVACLVCADEDVTLDERTIERPDEQPDDTLPGEPPCKLAECSICLSNVQHIDLAYICLRCRGVHHSTCQWLWQQHSGCRITCPTCRANLNANRRFIMHQAIKEQKRFREVRKSTTI